MVYKADSQRAESTPEGDQAVARQLMHLDRAVALGRIGGDEELLRELARLFLMEYEEALAAMRVAVQNDDRLAVKRTAHTLKGSVGNFGAASAFEACRRLETEALEAAKLETAVREMEAVMNLVLPEITAVAQGQV